MKKLYKIGDISKLYNISNDILRYYEKIGLYHFFCFFYTSCI